MLRPKNFLELEKIRLESHINVFLRKKFSKKIRIRIPDSIFTPAVISHEEDGPDVDLEKLRQIKNNTISFWENVDFNKKLTF